MLGRYSRILVVDGCLDSRRTTHRFLHALGYDNVDHASDGRPALRLLGQNQYRLVLADWDTTPVSGLDLLKAMRAERRSKRMPFIMAIERSQKKFIEIAREDGATLYINKPFTVDVLAERIAQVYADVSEGLEVRSQTAQTNMALLGGPQTAMVPKLWQSLRRAP